MPDADFEQLIGPYLANELDPETAARVRAHLEQSAGRQGFIAGIRAAVRSEHVGIAPDVAAAKQRLLATLDRDVPATTVIQGIFPQRRTGARENTFGRRRSVPRTAWYAAAAFAAIVVSVVAGWSAGSHASSRRPAANASTYTRYATANGQRATITLPDGSTVVLNVASRLEVPTDYAAGNHALRLYGEALFTVRRHDRSPFTVSAGGETARVLGTSFAVRRYSTDSMTTVAVRDGKVAVRAAVLTAGRQIEIGRSMARVERADTSRFAFASGVLAFDDRPFPDVIAELDRWFDADVRLGDAELARRRISVSFAPGSISDLVSVLQLMDLHVVRDGRHLTLFPR